MGTDTLLDMLHGAIWPAGRDAVMSKSMASFTGIDGQTDPGVAEAVVPVGIPGLGEADFTTDLIGKDGSRCPGLMSNKTCRNQQVDFYPNLLENGDGILCFSKRPLDVYLYRAYVW